MSKIARMFDVSECTTVAAVLARSGTDFTTETVIPEVEGIPVPGYRAIRRGDTGHVFGWTTSKYHTNSHREHMLALEGLVSEGTLRPVSVSVWDQGGMIAYQFEAPTLTTTLGPADTVTPLLTIAFGNDGKVADRAFFSSFRFFCKNQLGKVGAISTGLRHGATIVDRYADELGGAIRRLGGSMPEEFRSYRKLYNSGRTLSAPEVAGYFGEVLSFNASEARSTVDERHAGRKTLRGCLDALIPEAMAHGGVTAWAAYNAVTRYLTHHVGKSDGQRMNRAIFGNDDLNGKALSLALKAA